MDDSFTQNIAGVSDLVTSQENKTSGNYDTDEGVVDEPIDVLQLDLSDEELIDLKNRWERKSSEYEGRIKPKQDLNKKYYKGTQKQPLAASVSGVAKVVPSNLIFEAEENFIPQALSKNPEPVVWSDDTQEGKASSNEVKTMLQYHADALCLRRKLGVMLRHWSVYYLGVIKHGFDLKENDIKSDIRHPKNFILDPDGYIDEFGNYRGEYLGERMEKTASKLIELFPSVKNYILIKVDGKLGTKIKYVEWWTDDYCFSTFEDKVLDKHKNEYFNYDRHEKGRDQYGLKTETVTPGINHFGRPKMPYTFLSIFSFQEQPHDITTLIEQSIPNQDEINERDEQIDKNLRSANNSVVLSGLAFTSETASQARDAFYEEGFILVPNGDVEKAVKRLPASSIPDAVFKAQDNAKQSLRSIFGTEGLTAQEPKGNQTARGMILNQAHDSTRIGGGIGEALEQVADNIFNWWVQLYCVFYDTKHYGAIMGNGRAVEYVTLRNTNFQRKYVVSVSPNSMKPKDEISEQNLAIERWQQKAIDPLALMKALNEPDPINAAKMLVLWITNPQMYLQMIAPESTPNPTAVQMPQPGQNPPGGTPPEVQLSQEPANAQLNQVPLPK